VVIIYIACRSARDNKIGEHSIDVTNIARRIDYLASQYFDVQIKNCLDRWEFLTIDMHYIPSEFIARICGME
jgi:hypothetical protein